MFSPKKIKNLIDKLGDPFFMYLEDEKYITDAEGEVIIKISGFQGDSEDLELSETLVELLNYLVVEVDNDKV